jgi:hypothetical protein
MSYEEFLDLTLPEFNRLCKNLRYKNHFRIPLSDEEMVIREHMIKYYHDIKLQEQKHHLECLFKLDSYER